jgi:hypothetical protein
MSNEQERLDLISKVARKVEMESKNRQVLLAAKKERLRKFAGKTPSYDSSIDKDLHDKNIYAMSEEEERLAIAASGIFDKIPCRDM